MFSSLQIRKLFVDIFGVADNNALGMSVQSADLEALEKDLGQVGRVFCIHWDDYDGLRGHD